MIITKQFSLFERNYSIVDFDPNRNFKRFNGSIKYARVCKLIYIYM